MLAGKQEWDEGSCFLPFAGTCPRQILVICRINRLPLSLCPAAETSSHFTAGVVVSVVGVPGRGLPGGHNCLLQLQWKYRAGRLKTPFQDNIHIFSCRYLNCCSPVGAPCYHLPNSQCPSTMEDPTELGCSQPLCSCSGCKSNPLPGLPTQQGPSDPGEPGQQGEGTGCEPRARSHTSFPGAFGRSQISKARCMW